MASGYTDAHLILASSLSTPGPEFRGSRHAQCFVVGHPMTRLAHFDLFRAAEKTSAVYIDVGVSKSIYRNIHRDNLAVRRLVCEPARILLPGG